MNEMALQQQQQRRMYNPHMQPSICPQQQQLAPGYHMPEQPSNAEMSQNQRRCAKNNDLPNEIVFLTFNRHLTRSKFQHKLYIQVFQQIVVSNLFNIKGQRFGTIPLK